MKVATAACFMIERLLAPRMMYSLGACPRQVPMYCYEKER